MKQGAKFRAQGAGCRAQGTERMKGASYRAQGAGRRARLHICCKPFYIYPSIAGYYCA